MKENTKMILKVIKYACGHEELTPIPEGASERVEKLIAGKTCSFCREEQSIAFQAAKEARQKAVEEKRIEIEKQRKAELEDAIAQSKDLPNLKGSERQIAWAMVLRVKFMENLKNYMGEGKEELQNCLAKRKEAKFWIETKDYKLEELLDYLAEEKEEKRQKEEEKEKFGSMKYLRFSCGCNVRLRYHKDDTDFITWAKEKGICKYCLIKKLSKWRRSFTNVKQHANENNFPELVGTEKQIAWAQDIREGFRVAFNALKKKKNLDKIPYFAAIIPSCRDFGDENELAVIQEWLFAQTDAEFWIFINDMAFDHFLEYAKTEIKKTIKEKG